MLFRSRTLQSVQSYDPFGSTLQGLSSNPAFGNALSSYFNPYGNFGSGFDSAAAQKDYNRDVMLGRVTAGGQGE